MVQKPLLYKSCRPVSADENKRIRLAKMSEPPVLIETSLNLTVEERVAIEEAEAIAEKRPTLGAKVSNSYGLTVL